jgi:hypothetical protein
MTGGTPGGHIPSHFYMTIGTEYDEHLPADGHLLDRFAAGQDIPQRALLDALVRESLRHSHDLVSVRDRVRDLQVTRRDRALLTVSAVLYRWAHRLEVGR